MAKTLEQEIAELRAKEQQLKARIVNKENALKAKQKKLDTRKKILVGSYILDTLEKKGQIAALTPDNLPQYLDKFLTRKFDREVFNLPNLEAKND